jgi:superfamily II DNA or RNA helicase
MLLFDEKKYMPQVPRAYQEDAIDAGIQAWKTSEPAPLMALATGAGKTTIIAELLRRVLNPKRERALVIGHTEEIVDQLFDRIQNQFAGDLDTFFGADNNLAPGIGVVMGERNVSNARIVVASRQSVHPRRLIQLLRYGNFDYLIIDEAHHAFADNSYGEIIKTLRHANPFLKLLGVTATPIGRNGRALGAVWSKIIYEWLIPQGIAQGYLVPVTRVKVATRVNLSGVESSRGDYNNGKLASVLDATNWLELCEEAYATYIAPEKRPTLAFMPSVDMSLKLVRRLQHSGVHAAHIDANTPKEDRRKIIRDYQEGRISFVSNMGVLTEGFDAPMTGAILQGRPTQSQVLLTQMIGRGVRLHPGKHDCLLIDLTVEDTRVLEISTLMGKMLECSKCKADYYYGMKACPHCGYVPPAKGHAAGGGVAAEAGTTGEAGTGLVINYSALFEKAFAAWHRGDDGFLSCVLSFEDGALLIVPPLEDNHYRLVRVPKDSGRVEYINRNDDLAALMMVADEEVKKRGTNYTTQKDASWRNEAASVAQIAALKKWGVKAPENLSRGAASQLLTHAIAVSKVMQG